MSPYTFVWQQQSGPPAETLSLILEPLLFVLGPDVATDTTLTFVLTVTDALGQTATGSGEAVVFPVPPPGSPVVPPLQPLKVVSPPASVTEGQQASLVAVAQGGTGTGYTFRWTQVAGPSVTLFDGTTHLPTPIVTSPHLTFTAPLITGATTLQFQVVVTDSAGATARTTVAVSVIDFFAPLALSAVDNPTVHAGDQVTLHAPVPTGGQPPYATVYAQVLAPGTGGGGIALTGAQTRNPSFVAPPAPTRFVLTFRVTITDALGATVSALQSVTVDPALPPLKVTLTGPTTVDKGQTLAFSTRVSGGLPPYLYRYTVQGAPLTLTNDTGTNPTAVAPSLPADTVTTVSVVVTDQAVPTGSATATTQVTIRKDPATVAAPPAGTTPATPSADTGTTPIQANVCGDYDNRVSCTPLEAAFPTQQDCPPEKPYAMTDIFDTSGTRTVYRRCVSVPILRVLVLEILFAPIALTMLYQSMASYLLLGILFAFGFRLLQLREPAAFNFPVTEEFNHVYLSFIVLTSVGLGDMLPLTLTAKALVLLESIVGQLYLAFFVSVMIGKYLHAPRDTTSDP